MTTSSRRNDAWHAVSEVRHVPSKVQLTSPKLTGCAVKKRPPRVRKHDQPLLAGGSQHPGAEGMDSPALKSEMPRNADGAPPKLLLRCNFHSGKVVNKVSESLIGERNDG